MTPVAREPTGRAPTIWRGAAAAVAAVALVVLAAPGTAAADPAGPTDYESEVVAVDPPVPGLVVRVVGGDAFVEVDAPAGHEVIVLGYRGEPYLRISPDGTVAENLRSPATYENAERYGVDEVPAVADPDAAPEWRRVGDGGTWAWHDHRAHRMEPFPPVNVDRGEQVLDGVVPLRVDGEPVEVRVVSTWMPAPSPWPAVAGAAAGAGAVALLRRRVEIAVVAVAVAAVAVGGVQFLSLPASTGPAAVWWAYPAVAAVAAIAAAAVGVRTGRRSPWVPALTLVAAAELGLWGLDRRTGLSRAVLPTELPGWADRAVTAAALTAAVSAGVLALVALGGWARSAGPGRAG